MKRMMMIVGLLALATSARAALDWESSYDSALEKAKKEKKIVMVDIFTDWCGWCKKLDKDVYMNKDVQDKLAKSFIALKMNPEKNPKYAKLAQQYGTRGFPHIVFLDVEGKKFHEIGGYMPAADFLKQLDVVTQKQAK
jgi:thioredoxin-related protein